MRLMQKLEDQIFVDSTSSSDANESTATVLFSVTKADAAPIFVLILDSLAARGYSVTFNILKVESRLTRSHCDSEEML